MPPRVGSAPAANLQPHPENGAVGAGEYPSVCPSLSSDDAAVTVAAAGSASGWRGSSSAAVASHQAAAAPFLKWSAGDGDHFTVCGHGSVVMDLWSRSVVTVCGHGLWSRMVSVTTSRRPSAEPWSLRRA